ncbi:MAG: septal ring lytic transglycosylase RlpA family protein [Bacteroidota bacterium]|nr:septal ring lytic transglycosylase RlpA family protein [Bacteroidota bacterium]
MTACRFIGWGKGFLLSGCLLAAAHSLSQQHPLSRSRKERHETRTNNTKVRYGVASYYAKKFNGRRTANGEIYDDKKLTAACNVLPLGTWIRVTNLRNHRQVVVKVNDRLNIKNRRLVDLSRAAARKLGYIGRGLARVKVEVVPRPGSHSSRRARRKHSG